MFRLVLLQVVATAIVSLLTLFISGQPAALSAVLGGAACFVPNALFAFRLTAAAHRPGGPSVATFFVGEFLKVTSTVALLALIVWGYKDLVWPALIISVIASLKSYLVALVWR